MFQSGLASQLVCVTVCSKAVTFYSYFIACSYIYSSSVIRYGSKFLKGYTKTPDTMQCNTWILILNDYNSDYN